MHASMNNKIGPIEQLGTVWYFEFWEEIKPELETDLQILLENFNSNYSRFDPNSIISQLNKQGKVINPSPELQNLIKLGIDFYSITEGIFNFAQGSAMDAIGYDEKYSFKDTTENNTHDIKNPNKIIKISSSEIRLQKPYKVDLGGYGKGYLIDKIFEYLKKEGYQYFLINGGGDIRLTSNNDQDVQINLEDPNSPGTVYKSINLTNASLCASSPNRRKWVSPNTKIEHNHILGSQGVSSFVISQSATITDMLATTLCIRNDKEYIDHLQRTFSFGYELVEQK